MYRRAITLTETVFGTGHVPYGFVMKRLACPGIETNAFAQVLHGNGIDHGCEL